jgi:predicted  nucleic acid-binding Zn-ribbon protein
LIKINKKEYDILYDQHIKNIDQHNVLLTFVDKINQQNTNAKNEIKNLNKTVLKKSDTQKQLQKSIDSMQKDYDNYQIIKQYEKEKSELITKGIDIYNHYDDEFHNKRYQRNQLAHAY